MNASTYAAIRLAGYTPAPGDLAIMCASEPLEIWSASDWDSLARFAMNYELCDCGKH